MIKADNQIFKRKASLKKELDRIVGVIIADYRPEKIILFGSLATGDVHEWSDIDLVIIKNTQERFIKRLREVRRMTRPIIGVDFLVYTPGEVEAMKKEGRRFLKEEILEKGKLLYEKN